MTQQPFSRPGAIDLSGLKRPAGGCRPGRARRWRRGATRAGRRTGSTSPRTTSSPPSRPRSRRRCCWPSTRRPGCRRARRWRATWRTVAEEFEGRFLAGLVDIDAQPAIAQAVQLQSVPFVFAVIDGRPQPLIQDVLTLDNLRAAINQVMQQLTTQGITGRHQPRQTAPATEEGEDGEPPLDPRYAPAQDALEREDYDGAGRGVREAHLGQPRRHRGGRRAGDGHGCCSAPRTSTRRPPARPPTPSPDDVAAQTLVADLDLLGGQVDDAFDRLVDVVRRTAGDERNQAREHLLGLFAAVGNDDPRVLKGRQNLASALF